MVVNTTQIITISGINTGILLILFIYFIQQKKYFIAGLCMIFLGLSLSITGETIAGEPYLFAGTIASYIIGALYAIKGAMEAKIL